MFFLKKKDFFVGYRPHNSDIFMHASDELLFHKPDTQKECFGFPFMSKNINIKNTFLYYLFNYIFNNKKVYVFITKKVDFV